MTWSLPFYRILRAFRIFKAAQGLQGLIRTLGRSLKEVSNLGVLLALLFFITSVMVVEIFGYICLSNFDSSVIDGKIDRCNLADPNILLDPHATFINVGIALLSLFRICTGDNWSTLMLSTSIQPSPRPYHNSTAVALELLHQYIGTGNIDILDQARRALPICQSSDELGALSSVITCVDIEYLGYCPSTCGNNILSSLVFTFFMCASQYVLLNLVRPLLVSSCSF